jgi:hypothetical protein
MMGSTIGTNQVLYVFGGHIHGIYADTYTIVNGTHETILHLPKTHLPISTILHIFTIALEKTSIIVFVASSTLTTVFISRIIVQNDPPHHPTSSDWEIATVTAPIDACHVYDVFVDADIITVVFFPNGVASGRVLLDGMHGTSPHPMCHFMRFDAANWRTFHMPNIMEKKQFFSSELKKLEKLSLSSTTVKKPPIF